jgi:hypothetical protein
VKISKGGGAKADFEIRGKIKQPRREKEVRDE